MAVAMSSLALYLRQLRIGETTHNDWEKRIEM
jgi:hypothetical protein